MVHYQAFFFLSFFGLSNEDMILGMMTVLPFVRFSEKNTI